VELRRKLRLRYSLNVPTENLDNDPTPCPSPAWRAAEAAGCDMQLLEESLAASPEERLRLHGIALKRLLHLEAAMREARRVARPTP